MNRKRVSKAREKWRRSNDLSRVARWDSSGARTNAIYPPSVQVGFGVGPTKGGWVGGWVVNEGCFLDEKKIGFKRRGSEGRRDKWGREGGKDGKVKQRDVFFKNKDLAVSMSLIDFIQY